MKTTDSTTTARRLLDLVFEGHHVRTVLTEGGALFIAKDVAEACGLSRYRDAIYNNLDIDETYVVSVSTRHQLGERGVRKTQEMTALNETGVAALIMCSRKPAARRFRKWLLGEVLPQLIQYGSYLPGASRAERLQALHRRWRQERLASLEHSAAAMAESGLMTLKAFREEHAIPQRDILSIARRLTALAKADGIRPTKLTLKGYANPANTWPRPLLAAATNSTIPRLPL
jgi:prophage antirepressor-like protein